ncbi:MAG: phasin family protein, partial [Limibacillus sp.]
MTSKNPFLDADFRDFMDPAKLSERFKMTSFDPTAMTEMHRKNIEAIAEANRICFEGMQALGQRQAEIMRQSLEEAVAALKDMSAQPPAPEAQVSLSEIGEEAGLGFTELFTVAPSKTAILEALSRRVDAAVLSEGPL